MKTNSLTLKTNKMKKTILTLALAFVGTFAMAQEMTIAHTGITTVPVSTDQSLTVNVGDDITFIYGGGGSHPMTEGHPGTGAVSTPLPFITTTVSSSFPSFTFQINTAGTYKMHCATSPTNDKNYGTLYVLGEGGSTAVEDVKENPVSVYPNPATNNIIIEGINGIAQVLDVNGKKVMNITNGAVNISDLAKGTYIINQNNTNTIFIKK
jgi:plastocyanin